LGSTFKVVERWAKPEDPIKDMSSSGIQNHNFRKSANASHIRATNLDSKTI